VGAPAAEDYPQVRPGAALKFPRDHGSHPRFRNEWWYITGWLRTSGGGELGMQITFFRNRPRVAEEISSRFAPRQLLFAHAALADPGAGRLLHDQRAARAGFGLAEAAEGRTDVAIGDWSLKQTDSGYAAEVAARDFRYALRFEARHPVLLQGERGFSRKGPGPAQASYYYSRPHLRVSGSVVIRGSELEVSGEAWLDHEWSSAPLAEEAVGWDWIGINLADGGALMAFRLRAKDGDSFWAGGALRGADGRVRILKPGEVRFGPLRDRRGVSGLGARAGRSSDPGARAADGRPGARRAREHRYRLLGRRGAREARREGAGAGLSRADGVLEASETLANADTLRVRLCFGAIERTGADRRSSRRNRGLISALPVNLGATISQRKPSLFVRAS
jgi:predicted secreted hydrolase